MSEAEEIFDALGQMVNENTTEEGFDIVNMYVALFEAFKETPNITIEDWELFRLTINNGVAIMNNLVDEEIARLKSVDS